VREPERKRASIGSPEDYVRRCTDEELMDKEHVARMTRGLHWDPEPERFLRAAELELEWRCEQGVGFGWHKL